MNHTTTPPERVLLPDALTELARIQRLQPNQDWRLAVRVSNPGALSGNQTVNVTGIHAGFDWENGQVVLETAAPLTRLTPEDLLAIKASVAHSGSWHAHKREEQLRDRIKELEFRVKDLESANRPG